MAAISSCSIFFSRNSSFLLSISSVFQSLWMASRGWGGSGRPCWLYPLQPRTAAQTLTLLLLDVPACPATPCRRSPPEQLCIFKLWLSPGFPGNTLLGTCLPTKLPLPHPSGPHPSSPSSTLPPCLPSDALAPSVPTPPALLGSCEVQTVRSLHSSFSHLQPAPPPGERVFAWGPSLTLGQILYKWQVPVLPFSCPH